MKDALIIAIVSALTSGGFLAFIQFLITRRDQKDEIKEVLEEIKDRLDKNEKDTIRNQLLFLICLRPQEKQEILKLGEHYFKDLHGNWYLTSMFNKWLVEHRVAKPEWFNS